MSYARWLIDPRVWLIVFVGSLVALVLGYVGAFN
jgi:hypothetical protein